MEKRFFGLSYEMLVFKRDKLINRGICKNTNGLKDYNIIKTFEKDSKVYTIKEKYYDGEFFNKTFEVHDKKDYYIISAYTCPTTNTYWKYDTREDK